MRWTLRITALAALGSLLAGAGGCSTTIPANEFIAKYTTNIQVPNPDRTRLPTRSFLGRKGRKTEYYYLRDSIPSGQGGGLFGKWVQWRCPVGELPADFPQAYRPGDVVFDGRRGASHRYLIQSYVPPTTQPAASQPAAPKTAASPPVPPAGGGK